MLRITCCIAIVSALMLAGCSRSGNKQADIIRSLEIRTRALNTRDMHGYSSVISSRYNDKGKDALRLQADLASTLGSCEQMVYQPAERTIALHGNRAEAVGSYRMKISIQGRELRLNGTEHLTLQQEPGGWKIIAGL